MKSLFYQEQWQQNAHGLNMNCDAYFFLKNFLKTSDFGYFGSHVRIKDLN